MKSTKKSLLLSVLSTLLCAALFLGTTFAWFTDKVESGANKIVAGNLDIDVQYSKDNGATWADLEGSASVFSANLWEPGYTEYVTLKITNKGTLNLKYCMNVTPINEKGGVNVNGESFKLSDYLVFGTTAPAADLPTYDRASARAAVGATAGLSQSALTKSAEMAPNDVDYITLVVFMPENVGNEANHKTGTAAPEIELGIKFIATQLVSESDNFGNDYDSEAVNVAPYNVGPVYDYFPQVVASQPVAATGDTVISANGKLNKEDATTTELAKVTVPAEAVKEGVTELTVSVKPVEATDTTALNTIQAQKADGQEVVNFDIKVDGIKEGNTASITVEVFVGKGLNNVKAFHNGVEIPGAAYNAETGKITFETTSFSDYTVSYNPAMVAIGAKTYGTLALAIDAVKDGETIVLLKDIADAEGISVASGKNFTVDFNGCTYTLNKPGAGSKGTETNGFQLLDNSTIVFKNGTINVSSENLTPATVGKNIKRIIQNYANLTLKDMLIDGHNLRKETGVVEEYICSFSGGKVLLTGNTSIIGFAGKVVFDADTYHVGNLTEVTIDTTGKIVGKLEKNDTNGEAKLLVKAGTFSDDPSAFVADGFKAIEKDGLWTIVEKYEASIGGTMYKNLTDAINALAEGDTLVLQGDYSPCLTINKKITLDFNGYTISGTGDSNTATAVLTVNADVTLKDSSTDGEGGVNTSGMNRAAIAVNSGKMTIEAGKYVSDKGTLVDIANNCEVVINEGSFERKGISGNAFNRVIMLNDHAKLTINGGSFKGIGNYIRLIVIDDSDNNSVTINGGQFFAEAATNPSEAGGSGFAGGFANIIYADSDVKGTVLITGGDFSLTGNHAVVVKGGTSDLTASITGGSFSATISNPKFFDGNVVGISTGVEFN